MLAAAFVVVGCPVYDDECVDDSGCGRGSVCHLPSRECVSEDPDEAPLRCARPSDCNTGDTCDRFGRCRSEACSEVGCVSGYRCEVRDGFEHCMRGGTGGSGGEGGSGNEAGASNQAGAAGG